jgi:hypothetical protein
MNKDKKGLAIKLYNERDMTIDKICDLVGISKLPYINIYMHLKLKTGNAQNFSQRSLIRLLNEYMVYQTGQIGSLNFYLNNWISFECRLNQYLQVKNVKLSLLFLLSA